VEKNNRYYGFAILVCVISIIVGCINGVWVVIAGASYTKGGSPYYQLARKISPRFGYFIHDTFTFWFALIFAPLSGALLGAGIGWVASRVMWKDKDAAYYKRVGAISGGIAGFLSLSIVLLNIYAT